jgi:hypothetical protein
MEFVRRAVALAKADAEIGGSVFSVALRVPFVESTFRPAAAEPRLAKAACRAVALAKAETWVPNRIPVPKHLTSAGLSPGLNQAFE